MRRLWHSKAVELEPDFMAWCDQRDAAALGRVFDATGGKLLLLASHLSRSGAASHDLVQTTFLAAMRGHASWDRQRPLWPWLVGILQNEVAMQHRRGARRREVGLESADDAAADGQDPQHFAASQEVLDAVLAAIDALPLPYRQVLRLRLVHGLRPVEIARSLEVPVGTVRAQLHRGLEQLRERLPVGIAGVLATLLLGDDALLAQVKQHVLDESLGRVTLAKTTSGPKRPPLVTRAIALGALGVLVATFGTWLWPDTPPAAAVRAAQSEVAQPSRVEPPAQNAASDSSAIERIAAPATPTEDWQLVVTVKDPDGKPIAGASVESWHAARGGQLENDPPATPIANGTTDAEGVFRAPLAELGRRHEVARMSRQVWVRASWPNGMPETRTAWPLAAAPKTFTADIALGRAACIVGRLQAADGTIPKRANVHQEYRRTQLGGESEVRADGSFHLLMSPMREPPLRVIAYDAVAGLAVAPIPREGVQQGQVDVGTLVLRAPRTVTGRVVLGDGMPLAGVTMTLRVIDAATFASREPYEPEFQWLVKEITADDSGPHVKAACGSTGPDGSFLFALDATAEHAVVWLTIGMRRCVARKTRIDAGPLEITVDAQLVSIDAHTETGERVPGVRVRTEGYDPEFPSPAPNRPGFPATGLSVLGSLFFVDAEARLCMLSPFGWTWRIATSDPEVQSVEVRHDALVGVHRANVDLTLRSESSFGTVRVIATDQHGNPLRYQAQLQCEARTEEHSLFDDAAKAGGHSKRLPTGSWRVRVHLGGTHPQLDLGFRGSQEHTVVVAEGREAEVHVSAPPAGLVGFRLHSGRRFLALQNLRIEVDDQTVDTQAAELTTNRAGESPVPCLFVALRPLAPGQHRYRIEADGFQIAAGGFEVASDRLSEIIVLLLPR